MDPRKPGGLDIFGLVQNGVFVPTIGTVIKMFGCTWNISYAFWPLLIQHTGIVLTETEKSRDKSYTTWTERPYSART